MFEKIHSGAGIRSKLPGKRSGHIMALLTNNLSHDVIFSETEKCKASVGNNPVISHISQYENF